MNFESRHLIESLRSGVPSRSVGKYFSRSRSELTESIKADISSVISTGKSNGKVIIGKYGEGKTHLLNTIFSYAQEKNMVVSLLSFSKETPANNMNVLYKRIIENTYLPGSVEPTIAPIFNGLVDGSQKCDDLYLYTLKKLQTNRLYYVLKTLIAASNSTDDDTDVLEADLRGSFASAKIIKTLYKKYTGETASFNDKFVIKRHTVDYLAFFAHFFKTMGYNGWVILFDEGELIGRLQVKSRLNAYLNVSSFLLPSSSIESLYSLFAFSTSFTDEVIVGKNEFSSLALSNKTDDEKESISSVLEKINKGDELRALTDDEMRESIDTIIMLYEEAYDKKINIDKEMLLNLALSSGYLLRTKIRTVIEALDQILQYGDIGTINSKLVEGESLEESIDSLMGLE